MKTNKTNQKGFTLIELIIVMIILGVLMTIGINAFRSSQMKGRDSKRKAELKNVASALELYNNDYGEYPDDNAVGEIVACGTGTSVCGWGSAFEDQNDTLYMARLPKDARSGYNYVYDVGVANGKNVSFQLYARLENTDDNDVPKQGNPPVAQVYQGVDCGGDECNYGIASANTTADAGRTLVVD